MAALLFILGFLIVVAAIVAPIIYLQTRRKRRDIKNYERGLKMVPLLIHLPPPSEDTEGNGRDVRDVTDENISKAQIIYGIIASTLQKGFKAKFYGQRHFAFEIIASKGFVYFYAAVPVTLVEVVKQAIVSAYPSARLEETTEHNIFNQVGKLSGTVGGQLHLKESYSYPIATYQDLKRDAMQALLNSLSTLEKEDGAAIQILMRPADPVWRKNALEAATKKRKGGGGSKKGGAQLMGLGKDFATAFVKPPESKDGDKKDEKKDVSNIDQSIIDSMEAKTQQPGYEVLFRIVVSSNIHQRSQAVLNNVVAAFSLFDAPGRNGFKFESTKSVEELTTDYMLRIFPQDETKDILNTVELATIFHFPEQKNIPTSQLERQTSKQVDAPRNMPDEGTLLGYNIFRGVKKPVRLAVGDRQRHMYTVGQTGTGKSTFLENLALQDMLNGTGFAFVDPHGDTAEKLLSMVPRERTEDVIYFCPADVDYPMGLNLFEYDSPDEKDFLIQEVLNMLYKLYDPQHQGIMGPRYEHLFRNAALLIMADPGGGTFVDIPKLFRDPEYVKQKLQFVKDKTVLEFWQKEMPQSQRSSEFGDVVSWFVSKFGAFLSNEMMRNIIGQTKSAFNLREVMDDGKILIVNLSKGRLGQLNSQLLGMIFVMRFQAAAMSRANIPESERRDFALYVDEFQNFATDSFATILSEARKYHLNLIVANQFTTQLTDEIRDAVFGNTGTIVSFRVRQDEDAEALSKQLQHVFSPSDLRLMPNYNAGVQMLINGVPASPFSMSTLPPLGNPNPKLADALKQLSAAKYGRPKGLVEKEIFERLATKEAPPTPPAPRPFGGQPASPYGPPMPPSPYGSPTGPAPGGGLNPFAPRGGMQPAPYGSNMGMPPMQPQPQVRAPQQQPRVPGPGSFLDDWMSKRQSDGPLLRANPWSKSQLPPVSAAAPAAPNASSPSLSPPTTSPMAAAIAPANAFQQQPRPASPQTQPDLPTSPSVTYGDSEQSQIDDERLNKQLEQAAEEVAKKLSDPSAAPPTSVPEPRPVPATVEDKTVGEIPLFKKRDDESKDTIAIDKDGTLHIR